LIGIDWNGPLSPALTSEVQVFPPVVPLSSVTYDELCRTILPTEGSENFGIDIYTRTVHFLFDHMIKYYTFAINLISALSLNKTNNK